MLSTTHTHATLLHIVLSHLASAVCVSTCGLGLGVVLGRRWSRKPPEEVERLRREHLMQVGRLTSGILMDARTHSGEETNEPTPELLVYEYELHGVSYQCAQDVSGLAERVLGWRLGQPVSVRYDPANPPNSVIVTEGWGGRWERRRCG